MDVNTNVASNENIHGGARPGAGRPRLEDPRRAHSFSCTDSEAEIIRKVLAFLRAYPELLKEQINQNSLSGLNSTGSASKKGGQRLQWLESEEETYLTLPAKKVDAPSSYELQWLESEAEQEAMVKAEPTVRKSVLEAAKGLASIITDKL